MRFVPGCGCCEGGCGSIRTTVRLCSDGSAVAGATITVFDSAGATVGTGTTDAGGMTTVTIPAAGNYKVRVVKTGQTTVTVDVAATCTMNAILVELGRVLRVTAIGCGASGAGRQVVGATVTASRLGTNYLGITDASGVADIALPANGTYAVTIAEALGRLAYSGSVVVSCGVGVIPLAATMLPTAGYHCISWTTAACRPYPIADTLHLTDPLYGPTTLTWNNTTSRWEGSITVTIPACPPSPCATAVGVVLYYFLAPTSSLYTIDGGTNRWALTTTIRVNGGTGCPDPTNTGPLTGIQTWVSAVTCPPSAFAATMSDSIARAGTAGNMYCTIPFASITITE